MWTEVELCQAGLGASIMTEEGCWWVIGGLSPPEEVLSAQTSSGLLLQPPCPSQEVLPW